MSGRHPFGAGGGVPAGLRRRTVLQAMVGTGAMAAGLGACSTSGSSDTVTFGSNASDTRPKRAMAKMLNAFEDYQVSINTVDHNTFQENINSYLQGGPDDVFTWFAGYRMRYFAAKGLVGDVSDVWDDIGGNFSAAMKSQSTGEDGKQYFVPLYYYPWAFFHRKSLWQERGYEAPGTFDELKALCREMRSDGLTPIAFADSDGWPAMGTFDYLNLRVNGYEFHKSLMAGEKSWTSPQVKTVFETWRELMPHYQEDALGRTWQEGAQSLQKKECGTYLLGLFLGQQFPDDELDDLDFFPFPEIDSAIGTGAVEAPIDGFMMAERPRNEEGATALLRYLGTPEAEATYMSVDSSNIAASKEYDTSDYSELLVKSEELVSGAEDISQFMDRDTRPDFASTVMISALQDFIRNPDDIDGLTASIENQKKSIFNS